MNVDAKQTIVSIRKRIDTVASMRSRNPNLVRMATDQNGDQIAFWYAPDGKELNYNMSAAQRKINDLVKVHGPDILKSRSGQMVKIELPI